MDGRGKRKRDGRGRGWKRKRMEEEMGNVAGKSKS